MPEKPNKKPIRVAEEFAEGLATVYSQRLLDQIRNTLENLELFPEMGSEDVRESLIKRYGDGLRTIPISTFVIVYRYDGEIIDVLSLTYGPAIK